MDRYGIELVMTATEGSIHNIGNLICMAWVSANTYNPLHQETGHVAVLTRPNGGWGPLEAKESSVGTIELAEVVGLMRQLGIPQKMPRVQARDGNISGWQEITLDIGLDNQRGRLQFQLQYAGFEGEDAGPCGVLLNRLFALLGVGYLGRWIEPR